MSQPHFAIQSPALSKAGFRHAFFTRQGGTSQGPYASLNFSFAVGDDPACVEQSYDIAAGVLGVESKKICFLSQVHGPTVRLLSGRELRPDALNLEGDALISASSRLACAVRTADCVPILLGDTKTGRAAAVHAGWRGVELGVVEAALVKLATLGSNLGDLVAAIGPHISREAFEVGEDVARRLEEVSPDPKVCDRGGSKPHIDLGRIVEAQLLRGGVGVVDRVEGCTYLEPDRFFSFRRDGRHSGRHLHAIVPRATREEP